MNSAGHITVGLLAGVCIGHTNSVDMTIMALSSLMPDIDHPKSTLGRYNPLARFMKHRGFTHTLLGAAIVSLPFLYLNAHMWEYAYIGCLSHILADKLMSIFPGKRKFKLRII